MKPLAIATALSISFSVIAAIPAASQEEPNSYQELRIGVTGILCYTEPCPWNGIMRNEQPILPHALVWSGRTAPHLIGSPEDVARIQAAYADDCLIVNGRMVAGALEIDRIIGPCSPQTPAR